MKRTLATMALVLALALPASGGVKLLGGIDQSDNTRWAFGIAVQLTDVLWTISSVDFNTTEGEKKIEPMLAALIPAKRLPFPLIRDLPFKFGPIFGPEYEWTNEGSPTGDALGYLKAAIGGVVSISFDSTAQSGLVAYYKAAVELDTDAATTPLSPSFGVRLFVDLSALNLGL